jgi:glycosyltransferase involved in cell wall biosynthesis
MKLLIIDPNFSFTSPSMKGIVLALPVLKARGWEIEAWCWDCDDGLPLDRIVKLPRLGKMHTLYGYAFSIWARLRAWWKFSVRRESRPAVIYSIAWYLPQCDVAHVHFSHWDWERAQRVLGITSLRDAWERANNLVSLWWAGRFLRRTTAKCVLTVSDGVADDLRNVNPALEVHVLPNACDPLRYHSGVREEHRETVRAQLGFAEGEVVFAFASAGHYRRKGFFLAVEAVAKVRELRARLLVIGGTPKRLAALQAQLDQRHPTWREFITFTGMVPDVERYFAACDGFLFPSYSEAFGLVSLEAAACGLPLFLTRHQGADMMLEDGKNGRFVEFDADEIARVLAEFIKGEWKPQHPVRPKQALDSGEYSQRFADELAAVYEESHQAKALPKTVPMPLAVHHS